MQGDNLDRIILKFNSLMNKITTVEKKAVFIVNGVQLTTHQIHLLDAIGRCSHINITELANVSGVTKGAVSQKVSWLEKRGFIVKVREAGNNRETFLELTELGKEAFKIHEEYHLKFGYELFEILKNTSVEDKELINLILDKINVVFDKFIEE